MNASPFLALPRVSHQVVLPEELLAAPHPDRLFIDVRLGDPAEELESFRTAHIFGAVHAQIRDVFAAPPTAESGNLPLPELAALERTLAEWGVGEKTQVIVYGPSPALAARGWWVLRWAGLTDVRILDGGLAGWVSAGGAVAQGDAPPRPARASQPPRLSAGAMRQALVGEVEALGPQTILIDARDEASYLAGYIPGARNLPAADQWTPSRKLRTAREIAEIYAKAGITPDSDVVVYCGGGVLSAFCVMTLEGAGITPRLFVGSWSEWNKCPNRLARTADHMRRNPAIEA